MSREELQRWFEAWEPTDPLLAERFDLQDTGGRKRLGAGRKWTKRSHPSGM